MAIQRLLDPATVRARLAAAPAYSAYARAYLDPWLFSLAHFYEAASSDKTALVMHARGGLGPSIFTMGDPDLIGALMRLHPGPRQALITCDPAQVDLLLETHNLWRPQTMLRMSVDASSLTASSQGQESIRRLIEADAADLNRLYAMEDDGLHYSGRQVGGGIYYGAYSRGRLVASAGTHIYSAKEGVAVIGNVFTHPDHRGHGFGTAVTAAVTRHLLRSCDLVVLNVDPANRTARHIYESLGFREEGRLVEAMVTRRRGYSPLPFLRRSLARWRATRPYTEVMEM